MLEGKVLGWGHYFEPKFYGQLYYQSSGDREEKAFWNLLKFKIHLLWSLCEEAEYLLQKNMSRSQERRRK